MLKNLIYTLIVAMIATTSYSQKVLKSPREKATGTINNTNIVVDYGAPSVRDREIWGALVPYNKVWRAGANENTTLSFDKDVTIGNTLVPAGKYGFFIIPSENGEWTIILNKKNDAWGAFTYDQKDDLLRLNIVPTVTESNQEMLLYKVEENGILLNWGKVELLIPIK